jgi:Glycosyl transferase family 2
VIAVISASLDEADVIECWVRHHLAEGVDLILVVDGPSKDGTRGILDSLRKETGKVEFVVDPSDVFYQRQQMTKMAAMAGSMGADWIIPADADEFWVATSGRTLAEELTDCPHEKLIAPVYHHVTWESRWAQTKIPKVAFRYRDGVEVETGNHGVNIPGGVEGVLAVHELMFRGFEHFCDKTASRRRTIDPEVAASGGGNQHMRTGGLDREGMEREWGTYTGAPRVGDPIPTRTDVRPRVYSRSRA